MFPNIVQLAESLGVEESEVESWVGNDGLPHATDRKRPLFDRARAASHGLAAGYLAPERADAPTEDHLETMLQQRPCGPNGISWALAENGFALPRPPLEIWAWLSIALTRGTLRQLINESVAGDKIFAPVAAPENTGKKEGAT